MSKSKMTYDEAHELFNNSLPSSVHGTEESEERIQEAREVILRDAYEFLENENFHTAILVIEQLTGIDYD